MWRTWSNFEFQKLILFVTINTLDQLIHEYVKSVFILFGWLNFQILLKLFSQDDVLNMFRQFVHIK